MRIPSGKTDQNLYFVAVDATDLKTRETGLSSWTVVRSRNGAADVTYTTPTITEIDNTTMPGVYALLVDEDTTIASGSDSEEYCVHITHAGMAPVTRTIELYRRDTTSGSTLSITEGDFSDILSRLTVTNSQLLIVKSDTSDVRSHLVVIHSETTATQSLAVAIEAFASDTYSDTTAIHTQTTKIDSDLASQFAIIEPFVSDIYSDTTAIHSDTTHIHSDTTTLASDLAEADFSDIHSLATKIYSDTTAIEGTVGGGEGDISDVLSRLTVTNSQLLIVKSDTSDIKSHLTVIAASVSDINSDTNKIVSDLTEVDTSDIQSLLTKVYSDTTAIEGAGGSLTAAQDSKLTQIHSDQASQFAVVEPFVSDIYSDTTAIHTQTTAIASQVLIVKSDTSDIKSAQVKIYSDTTLATDAAGEPGQGDPPVSATPQTKIGYLFKAWRNKTEQTSSEYSLYADDGTTKDQKATVSDDATTFTRGEVGTGA